jgi:hypothetical protein
LEAACTACQNPPAHPGDALPQDKPLQYPNPYPSPKSMSQIGSQFSKSKYFIAEHKKTYADDKTYENAHGACHYPPEPKAPSNLTSVNFHYTPPTKYAPNEVLNEIFIV